MDGCPVSRVLVDNGAALNVMPITMLKVLGKTEEFYQKMSVCPLSQEE